MNGLSLRPLKFAFLLLIYKLNKNLQHALGVNRWQAYGTILLTYGQMSNMTNVGLLNLFLFYIDYNLLHGPASELVTVFSLQMFSYKLYDDW